MSSTSIDQYAKKEKTKSEIQAWLIDQIAGILFIELMEIDIHAPFSSYGLSSRDAVVLSGDLEEWLDRRLSPTIVYEYPNIDVLSAYLSGELDDGSEAPTSKIISDSSIQGLGEVSEPNDSAPRTQRSVADLEKLSEEEVEAILQEKLDRLAGKK